jgi:malate permease and related proteins
MQQIAPVLACLANDLEPDLIALLIGIGVPLSILTTWGCWALIQVL